MEIPAQTAKFGPGASRIFTSQERYIIAVAGARGGKTTAGSYWSYDQATRMRTEMTTKGPKQTAPAGFITAPTYDLLRHSTLLRFFEEFPMLERYYKEYKKEMNIPILKIGGKAQFSKIFTRSLEEPKNLRGIRAWWGWLDEGDIAPAEAWEIAKSRISDHEDGKLLVTSTLYLNSWINRLIYEPMQSGQIGGVDIISWPSIERPGFPLSEWNRLKSEMDPISFAREYGGEFSFEHGLVYGDILQYGIISVVPEGVTMLATFYAIDYGLNHPTVIMVMGYGSNGAWYVLNEYASPMMDVNQINDVIESNLRMYKEQYGDPWATYYDPAGGIAALSITPDCFPLPAVKDIPGRVTLVRNFIYQKRVYVLDTCPFTIKELGLYTFDPVKHLPLDRNNHAMDDMGYIIHNAWGLVDGLSPEEKPRVKNRVELDLEERGLLKDGVFQNIHESEDNFIV